jgi:hypothetical protein
MGDDRIDELVKQVRRLTLQVQSLERALHKTDNPPIANKHTIIDTDFNVFATGDRVRILNTVRKPTKWNDNKEWSETEARYATVTRIQGGRVFLITDNGISTWRSPKNLSGDTQDE